MKYAISIIFLINSINLLGQVKDTCQSGVGTFNAPEIKIIDYQKIDFALRKTLTNKEYENLGNGLVVISIKIDSSGNIKDVYSLDYKGWRLCNKDEKNFKLNLIKYIKFKVPDLYKELLEIKTSVIYKKTN